MTIYKSQGQTLNEAVINLGWEEKKKIDNIGDSVATVRCFLSLPDIFVSNKSVLFVNELFIKVIINNY